MSEIIPGLAQINWLPYIGKIVYWIGISVLGIAILAVFVAIYYLMQFKIKATVIPLYGSGRDGTFAFGKPKTTRIRWINNKTIWRGLYPLFNKKDREPFDSEYIYPGDRVIIFELNDEWMPGRINVNKGEKEIRTEINPVPYYIRNWQSLTHKKLAEEFTKSGFWEENKVVIMTIVAVLICSVLCGVTIYFTYKFAMGGRADISMLTNAINNFATTNAPQ